MDKAELVRFLRENLEVRVLGYTQTFPPNGVRHTIEVQLVLEGEIISVAGDRVPGTPI